MKKFLAYLKEFRTLALFFSLFRMIFRILWMLCLIIYSKRMLKNADNSLQRVFRWQRRNTNDPLWSVFLAYYSKLPKKPKTSADTDGSSMKNKLIYLMETQRLYMNHNLTLKDMSRELATNRTYLSKEIKHSFQSGFRDYLNRLRLEKARELLLSAEFHNLNLTAISEQSGFRNYGTFNSVFKKVYGITPGEWKILNTQQQE